jgi:spore maturation protein CgeB
MRLVFLGLSLSSSWGNGHATTYRALLRALAARGHELLFLERDQPWYAAARDMPVPGFCELALYGSLDGLEPWRARIAAADAVVLGSYVTDGVAVAAWLRGVVRGVFAFYDIDTPVTLARLAAGESDYVDAATIAGFDLYLSFTGGPTLARLEREHGARRARAFYCSVDPEHYRATGAAVRWDLGYLGTYSADRQPVLERLLLEPARRTPHRRFVVAGPQYPDTAGWPGNVERIEHLPPVEHAGFYSACAWTLNVTRADMVAAGWSPSVRLFEAAACATPIVSDPWPGLDEVLRVGPELRVAERAGDVLALLDWPEPARRRVGEAGRARVLAAHTSAHRAAELEGMIAEVREEEGQGSALDPPGRAALDRHT